MGAAAKDTQTRSADLGGRDGNTRVVLGRPGLSGGLLSTSGPASRFRGTARDESRHFDRHHYPSEDGGETFRASNQGVGAGFAPDPYPEFGQAPSHRSGFFSYS
jgi:hypothetical protein